MLASFSETRRMTSKLVAIPFRQQSSPGGRHLSSRPQPRAFTIFTAVQIESLKRSTRSLSTRHTQPLLRAQRIIQPLKIPPVQTPDR